MDQHSLTLQLRFQRLLAKLFPQELYYIGGPDPLPPPLSPEEEREMTRRLKNHDEAARSCLIEHNLRLVVFISRRFENTGHSAGGSDLHRHHRPHQGRGHL